ncbi:translation initiation factor eIF-2B subunit alpha-like [Octopus vulgaris]|uniref:Translation initiation factor eIF-2B subunit alpha-like n=2 Tax=Octopus TaxID=6643 RepID=A0AA36BVE7_OCTVU|nr:translation initiation factor eIF-2B subunit alpha [Octopus sinensis]CAI9740908.1 translation initiation factor eIF-2B subunit alpha-like [Octopus vulgaris]
MKTKEDILKYFDEGIRNEPENSTAVAAVKTLLEIVKGSDATTLTELLRSLEDAEKYLDVRDENGISVRSACQLYLRFITFTSLEFQDFQECRRRLVERGELFLEKVTKSRDKISKLCKPFLRDGMTILTHSRSRVVLQVLKEAARDKKRFNVFVTESRPNESGRVLCNELKKANIPTLLILDAAVSSVMPDVDLVLVGAESVVESGGIINRIGTFNIALAAKAFNKPVYVVAEFFKFARFFPLTQKDLPKKFEYKASLENDTDLKHPAVDYTPPNYMTLLFTDLGILLPSAVSDELIKLYS